MDITKGILQPAQQTDITYFCGRQHLIAGKSGDTGKVSTSLTTKA